MNGSLVNVFPRQTFLLYSSCNSTIDPGSEIESNPWFLLFIGVHAPSSYDSEEVKDYSIEAVINSRT